GGGGVMVYGIKEEWEEMCVKILEFCPEILVARPTVALAHKCGYLRFISSSRFPNALQVSLEEQKSHKELEAKQNVKKVKKHLMAEEIEKLVDRSKNVEEIVEVASSALRNDDNQTNPESRLEPMNDKESLEVEKIADISQHVNVIEEEEESTEDDYE
nr:hypothetical protein [Tanacetum cinerariifolium]